MAETQRSMRVWQEDLHRMRTECVQALVAEKPDLEGVPLTDAHMFRRLIKFYLGERQ